LKSHSIYIIPFISIRVFYNKGCTCVECGIAGTLVALGRDKGGGLHLDVYTDDFYPLTVDHILPKSKGGSDDLDNLQPMCCLCNWSKGNGDKPANIGHRKHKYEKDIPKPKTLPKFDKDLYIKETIKSGNEVFKKTGEHGRKVRRIGIVNDITTNPITGKESATIEGKPGSYYHLSTLFKKIS